MNHHAPTYRLHTFMAGAYESAVRRGEDPHIAMSTAFDEQVERRALAWVRARLEADNPDLKHRVVERAFNALPSDEQERLIVKAFWWVMRVFLGPSQNDLEDASRVRSTHQQRYLANRTAAGILARGGRLPDWLALHVEPDSALNPSAV